MEEGGARESGRETGLRLLTALAERIARADTFEAALEAVLRAICRHAGWRYGESWLADRESRRLERGPVWHAGGLPATEGPAGFPPGEGLPGRVWRSRRRETIHDLEHAAGPLYHRRAAALEAGFRSAVGLPLAVGAQVFAVLVFEIDRPTRRTARITRLVEALSPQLYSLLQAKAATAAALADRRRLAELIATVGEAIISIDSDQRIVDFNHEAERLFGYQAAELVGQPLDLLMPEGVGQRHHAQILAFAAAPESRRLMGGRPAIRGRRRDGSEFITEAAISRLEIDGQMIFTAVLRDVTELRRAEASLRESEQRFRDIADVTGDWLWETDADHRIIYVSGRTREAKGFGDEQILGKTIWQLAEMPPEEAAQWERHRATLDARQPFRDVLYRATGSDRQQRYLIASGMPIFHPDGRFRGYRGATKDVTAEIEMQREVESKSALLATTFETIGDGVVVIGPSLTVAAFNRRLLDLLGLPRTMLKPGDPAEHFVRLCITASVHDEGDTERLIARELAELRRFRSHVTERRFRHGLVLEIRGNPLPAGGIVRTYADITLRTRVESELRSSALHAQQDSQAKSRFLAHMSHELRTPLNAIIGFSDLMRSEAFGPLGSERYRGYAHDIHQSGTHLLAIINDILDLSKAEAGRQELNEHPVDLPAAVEASIAAVRPLALEGDVAVTVELCPGVPPLKADPTKLRQILINLLSNAVKFTPPGGSVAVDARLERDGTVVIAVRDTGIGMAPEDIPVALQPFRQLDAGLGRKYPGTGLGLPLTKRLIELHGGILTIDSTPGQGTRAEVRLPAERVIRPGAA